MMEKRGKELAYLKSEIIKWIINQIKKELSSVNEGEKIDGLL
jgi:hypothetical protein